MNQLSFVGRVTLAITVIEALPTYCMMTPTIPKACLKEIQQMHRDFISDDSDESHHLHTIRWSKIAMENRYGGLGIRKLELMNQACLAKLSWCLLCGNQALWCEVLRRKYISHRFQLEPESAKDSYSSLWKQLSNLWSQLESKTYWELWNGKNVRFLDDARITLGLYLNSMMIEDIEDHNSLQKLKVIPPLSYNSEIKNVRLWSDTAGGTFLIALMYTHLSSVDINKVTDVSLEWKFLWKIKIPECIRFFIWKMCHNRLPTNQVLGHLQIWDRYFDYYRQHEESSFHALHD
ncbi:unnamed protein product [Lathyrus sativus]|nr:unnamed protein product [Lathyrus sativus]